MAKTDNITNETTIESIIAEEEKDRRRKETINRFPEAFEILKKFVEENGADFKYKDYEENVQRLSKETGLSTFGTRRRLTILGVKITDIDFSRRVRK